MPYVRSSRRHASKRHLKKRVVRAIMFVAVIIAATYALGYFFQLSNYAPAAFSPQQDQDRELLMKKLEEAGQKAGEIPLQPSRQSAPAPHR